MNIDQFIEETKSAKVSRKPRYFKCHCKIVGKIPADCKFCPSCGEPTGIREPEAYIVAHVSVQGREKHIPLTDLRDWIKQICREAR